MQVNFAQKSEALLREGGSLRSAPRLAVGQPAALRWPDISRRVCRGQFLWAEARAKCFSRRTRRREKRIGFFLRRCGANSVRLERGAPGFAGHSSFARLYKASRFRAAARNVFYGKAKRTVQTKRSARFFFVTPVSSSGSAPLRRGRPRGRGWPRGGWCRRWAPPCRDCPNCRDCPADPASPGYSPEW